VTHVGVIRGVYRIFFLGNLKERENFEVLGLGGRIIIKRVFKNWHGGLQWTDLAQDRDGWWRDFVSAVMRIRIL